MIYSVEDDPDILDLVLYALRQSGFEARGFAEGDSFLAALGASLPQLVLLDQMLPGLDGAQLLARLKGDPKTRRIPVIMLTAKDAEMDKVRALDAGADDYIVKPFGIMELISRVRAVLRRSADAAHVRVLTVGPLRLDTKRQEVWVSDREISLTNKEFALLHCLMDQPGIVLSREQLLSRVWETDYVGDTRTVDMHIRTLRVKLQDAAGMIQTRRGLGYQLSDSWQTDKKETDQ